jgi:hypothetical protein
LSEILWCLLRKITLIKLNSAVNFFADSTKFLNILLQERILDDFLQKFHMNSLENRWKVRREHLSIWIHNSDLSINWWVIFLLNFIKITVKNWKKFCWNPCKMEDKTQQNSMHFHCLKWKTLIKMGLNLCKLHHIRFFLIVQRKVMKIHSKPIISLSIDN